MRLLHSNTLLDSILLETIQVDVDVTIALGYRGNLERYFTLNSIKVSIKSIFTTSWGPRM